MTTIENSIAAISQYCEMILTKAEKTSSVEDLAQLSRELKEVLKSLSGLQKEIGIISNKLKELTGRVRKFKPKDRPKEGEIRFYSGSEFLFQGGKWWKLEKTPEKESS